MAISSFQRAFLLGVGIVFTLNIVIPILSFQAYAASPTPNDYGDFEVLDQLPSVGGIKVDKNIGAFVKNSGNSPLVTIANIFFQLGLAILVMVSLILVIIGGYVYMTAGGSSERIGLAKKIIGAALAGVIIGLMGWLILNTISSQFTEPSEPTIKFPSPTI